eukprot:TRINITY_DN3533_c0_g1_i2.p1 TRINITY_DN3533_c0_g1~~TRINITY_DN3533_c0_g1_i2.p1  ORF type:complete len:525 (+),score=188.33 TRINITY_DN3533_c0_g1_i2:75-1649(+)
MESSRRHLSPVQSLSPRARWWDARAGQRDEAAYQRSFNDVSRTAAARLQFVWADVAVPREREACALQLKHLVRRGISDQFRPGVWLALSGSATLDASVYTAARANAFGPTVPDDIALVPTFGASLDAIGEYPLSGAGVKSAHRVLVMLAMLHPEIEHMPTLLDLVCALLLFMSEADVYTAVHNLVLRRDTAAKHLLPTQRAHELAMATLDDLISWRLSAVHAHMKRLGVRTADFGSHWFQRLFAGSFPLPTMLRVFDAFLNEGSKILYRAALGFIKLHKQRLLQTATSNELLACIRQLAAQQHDADDMMKAGFGLQLSREHTKRLDVKNRPKVANVVEPVLARVYYRPRLSHKSCILADVQFETLWSWLPSKVSIRDPELLFTPLRDGYTLSALLRAVERRSPTLIVIKTSLDEVFGAYASCAWPPVHDRAKNGYYFGDRSCFVWTLSLSAAKYGWTEQCPHSYFQHVGPRLIQVGGGDGIALQLDDSLARGLTGTCSSFLNPPLTRDKRETFDCVAIEVYGFF